MENDCVFCGRFADVKCVICGKHICLRCSGRHHHRCKEHEAELLQAEQKEVETAREAGVKYPQHEKLRSQKDVARVIGEFLDWLEETRYDNGENMEICYVQPHVNYDSRETIRWTKTEVIGRFIGVDPKRLEDEKQAMLEELRRVG